MENKEFMNIIEGLKGNINDKIKDFLENSQELKDFIDLGRNISITIALEIQSLYTSKIDQQVQ